MGQSYREYVGKQQQGDSDDRGYENTFDDVDRSRGCLLAKNGKDILGYFLTTNAEMIMMDSSMTIFLKKLAEDGIGIQYSAILWSFALKIEHYGEY